MAFHLFQLTMKAEKHFYGHAIWSASGPSVALQIHYVLFLSKKGKSFKVVKKGY